MLALFTSPTDFNKQVFDVVKMILDLPPFQILMRHFEIILWIISIPIIVKVIFELYKIYKKYKKNKF